MDTLKRYVFLRMKLNALLCFGTAAPLSLLFLIVALRYDALPYDLLLPLVPLGIAAVVFAVCIYQPIRFLRMVRRQEEMFGVTFGKIKFRQLAPRSRYHMSPDWFISMGSWAFYCEYVVKVTYQVRQSRGGWIHYIHVETADARVYKLRMASRDMVKKMREWAREHLELSK